MKTYIFNSETEVYISNANSREEAIEKIREQLNIADLNFWNEEGLHETTRQNRLKHHYFDHESFEDSVKSKVHGMENYELEDGETIIYFHVNE